MSQTFSHRPSTERRLRDRPCGLPLHGATLLLLAVGLSGCRLEPLLPVEVTIQGDTTVTFPQQAEIEAVVSGAPPDHLPRYSWDGLAPNDEPEISSPDEPVTLLSFPAPGEYEVAVTVELAGETYSATHTIVVLEPGQRQVIGMTQTNFVMTGFDKVTGAPYPVASTDPAGIGYYPPSGNFLVADSEIDEIPAVYPSVRANLFEADLARNEMVDKWDLGGQGTAEYANLEPTGVTYCDLDGRVYTSNDDSDHVTRYSLVNGRWEVEDWISTRPLSGDPEGIACDPDTGYLYVTTGAYHLLLVYVYRDGFRLRQVIDLTTTADDPANVPTDSEGIALDPISRHLFLISAKDHAIFEFTVTGEFVRKHDLLAVLNPPGIVPQGLTFGPSTSNPGTLALFIADGGRDNGTRPEERDGFIYEISLARAD